jgi:hypothetical protein
MKDLTAVFFFFAFIGVCMFLHPRDGDAQGSNSLRAVAVITGSCTLNGSLSYDPNKGGYIKTFHWSKISGGNCKIVSPDSAKTEVVGLRKGNYEFMLKVVSSEGLSSIDSTSVIVRVN